MFALSVELQEFYRNSIGRFLGYDSCYMKNRHTGNERSIMLSRNIFCKQIIISNQFPPIAPLKCSFYIACLWFVIRKYRWTIHSVHVLHMCSTYDIPSCRNDCSKTEYDASKITPLGILWFLRNNVAREENLPNKSHAIASNFRVSHLELSLLPVTV